MSISLTSRMTGKTMSIVSFVALLIFLPLLLLAAYQTATIISRATGKPANIIIDAGAVTSEKIDPTFMYALAQSGKVQKEISALRPKWIRIDHIYDFYDIVKNDVSGSLSFDFSRLDPIIESIRAAHATPVISLSSMPPAIAKDGKVTNAPKNWSDWTMVIQKTIEHISGSSEKNIPEVYYEVWNEPNHEQSGGWDLTGEKNYLTLYHYAAVGAGEAKQTQKFFLGGPATRGLYKNWIINLINSGDRVDFLSWHSYLLEPERFPQDQRDITSWLLPYPNSVLLPKLITEYGFTGSLGSAYTASVFRQLVSGSPTALFTSHLESGYIYSLLSRMAGNRVLLTGEGTWVTGFASKQTDTIRIMLINFDASGSHTETTPITITNLPNGMYGYSQEYLQGNTPGEAQKFMESVIDGTLKKQIYMPAQALVLIELYPASRRQ